MQENDREIHDLIIDNDSYMDVLMNDNRWEVLYNLSPLRENLLEWYPFDKSASLLEVNAEFGALTSLYCRKVKHVLSLCSDELQKNAIEHRCRDYSNLQVIRSISDINEKFDYIAIINPIQNVEEIVDGVIQYLSYNGKIIIACDNSLALRYFLNDIASEHSICVSKNHITKYLSQRQFNDIDFYYPSPDFRLPNAIYSEKYLPHDGDLRNVNPPFVGEKYQVINEDYVYDMVCDENIYENMANSFLIIASK